MPVTPECTSEGALHSGAAALNAAPAGCSIMEQAEPVYQKGLQGVCAPSPGLTWLQVH